MPQTDSRRSPLLDMQMDCAPSGGPSGGRVVRVADDPASAGPRAEGELGQLKGCLPPRPSASVTAET